MYFRNRWRIDQTPQGWQVVDQGGKSGMRFLCPTYEVATWAAINHERQEKGESSLPPPPSQGITLRKIDDKEFHDFLGSLTDGLKPWQVYQKWLDHKKILEELKAEQAELLSKGIFPESSRAILQIEKMLKAYESSEQFKRYQDGDSGL